MSELTMCNYCTLQDIISRHGKQNIKLVADRSMWIVVWVRDTSQDPTDRPLYDFEYAKSSWSKLGVAFIELTTTCVC